MADTDKLVKVGQLDTVADAVVDVVTEVNERLTEQAEALGAYTETTDNAVSNSASFWSQGGYDSSVAYKVHSESIPITQLGPLYFGGICTGTELTANSAITLRLFDSEDNLLHSSGARTLTSTWARSGINLNSYPTVDHIIIDFNTNAASIHVTPETFVDNYKVYVGHTSIDSYDNFYDHTIQKYGIVEDVSGLQTDIEELSANVEELSAKIESAIPDYWQSYMDTKVSTLQTLDGEIGNHGVGFVFVTDEHWPNNAKKSPILIKHIQENTSVKMVVNGGDILTKHADKATALSVLCAFRNAMPEGMFSVLGNHDRNSNGTNGQDNTLWLSEDQVYGTLLKDIEEDVTFGGELYYYRDLPNQKFRMIFLNTGYDTAMGVGTAQLSWLQQRLYELQDGWTAVIFQHYVWQEASASVENLTMGAPGTSVKNIVDGQYANMTAHGAHFAGIICGHVHRDYSIMAENGYPIIGTTCDAGGPQAAADPVNPTRTVGTTLEQAFDVFHIDTTAKTIKLTRIGAGSDRSFSYA